MCQMLNRNRNNNLIRFGRTCNFKLGTKTSQEFVTFTILFCLKGRVVVFNESNDKGTKVVSSVTTNLWNLLLFCIPPLFVTERKGIWLGHKKRETWKLLKGGLEVDGVVMDRKEDNNKQIRPTETSLIHPLQCLTFNGVWRELNFVCFIDKKFK